MVDGQQRLVIKTWEKVRHEESFTVFNIKTIRIFDSLIQSCKAILTEQVDGNFARHHFYDTSTLKFRSKIYYFKRVQVYERAKEEVDETYEDEEHQRGDGLKNLNSSLRRSTVSRKQEGETDEEPINIDVAEVDDSQ